MTSMEHVAKLADFQKYDLSDAEPVLQFEQRLLDIGIQDRFEGGLIDDIVIRADRDHVRKTLIDYTAWARLVPSVVAANVVYGDEFYQEIELNLTANNHAFEAVRLVCRSEQNILGYFYPEPARFLKHHCGDLLITSVDRKATKLTIVERWNLSERAGAIFPLRHGVTPGRQVTARLRLGARLLLHAVQNRAERFSMGTDK